MPLRDARSTLEQTLHQCFGHSPVPTCVCTRSAHMVYQNLAAQRSVVTSPGNEQAPQLSDHLCPESLKTLRDGFQQLSSQHPAQSFVLRPSEPEGGPRTVQAYIFGDHDHIVLTWPASAAPTLNLTETSEANEHSYRTIAQGTHDAIWEWDCARGTLTWHSGLHAVFGYDDSNLDSTYDAWLKHVHPDDHDRVVTSLDRALARGAQAWVEEYRFRRADGSWAHVVDRGFVVDSDSQGPTRLIGGLNDVTADRLANATIRQQARLIEQTHDAIWVIDFENIVRFCNPSVERLFGTDRRHLIGAPLSVPDYEAAAPSIDMMRRRGLWQGVAHHRTTAGEEVILEERWSLLVNEHDHPQAILIVGTDITERRALLSQFLRAQRVDSMGSLAAGMVHDLNNMLVPIHFGVEFLRLQLDRTNAEVNEVLIEIAESVQGASAMLHHVLNFARGETQLPEPLDLPHIISEVFRVAMHGHAHRISTHLDYRARRWQALGNPPQIHQLLLNLCINARDAIASSGHVEVAVSELTLSAREAAVHPDARPGDYLRIDIRDNGQGMSDAVRARIFEPFYTTKEPNHGTGIGLPTSMAIVRSHGGFMTVKSAPGEGAIFSIFLRAV
ncbi:PAS domain S-box protein [Bradymonadaceae bacterium TMQ3]|nr:PAS domain S-box protein [Bradymonadaceae bacterium TMQ3]TXC77883.1 PAS domain S-box protein [Bradymonadales bacterium TMQ1]